jgi:hypothetical protein
MKGNNPPRQPIPLYCSQSPEQIQLAREAEAELYHFSPIRDGDSATLFPSIPAAQQTTDDSEGGTFCFPPIKEGNSAPLLPPIPGRSRPGRPQATQRGSQKPPLSSKEEPSQSQRRQQPNIGLGRANIVNMAAVRPYTLLIMNGIYFHQAKSSLKQDSGIQDVADEHPMKKRRVTSRDENNMELVRYRIAGLKERVEKVAAEARDITSALEELLRETQ